MLNKLILTVIISLIFISCSNTKFLGAQKYISHGTHVERWFLNPEYNKKDIPKGTKFYGASAEKIKHKFIIKYYKSDFGNGSILEIPYNDMWKVKHNGKRFHLQDDDNLFYYSKNNETFVKSNAIANFAKILPIKQCFKNGWCKMYPDYYHRESYIRKSILYK